MKVYMPAAKLYAYPDVTIVCGPCEFADARQDVLLNPAIVVEVLSETTERFDRGLKSTSYRQLPSLREYVLVSQDEAHVEHYARQDDGSWMLREARAGGRVTLEAIGCTLEVDEVYLKVFEAPDAD
jgi:Uma2 family endonuclease